MPVVRALRQTRFVPAIRLTKENKLDMVLIRIPSNDVGG